MNYRTLLKPTSPRLAELEAKLGKEGQRRERPSKPVMRPCADGITRPRRRRMTVEELSEWVWRMAFKNTQTGCWEWMGTVNSWGYGVFKVAESWLAHRFAAFCVLGHLPDLLVLHSCDNPKCINPSHLWLGTNKDNSDDKVRKGRQSFLAPDKNGSAKLSWSDVAEIRSSGMTTRQVMDRYGLTQAAAYKVRLCKTWKV